jgi:hypothetical protein
MLAPGKMLLFALECLRAAERTPYPSQHDVLLRRARSWINTAKAIAHRAGDRENENSRFCAKAGDLRHTRRPASGLPIPAEF